MIEKNSYQKGFHKSTLSFFSYNNMSERSALCSIVDQGMERKAPGIVIKILYVLFWKYKKVRLQIWPRWRRG